MIDAHTPTILDFGLFVLIGVGLPVWSYVSHRVFKARLARGDADVRWRSYNETLMVLWGSTVAVLGVWLATGRPFAELGLAPATGWAAHGALALAVVGSVAFAWQAVVVPRSEAARASIRRQLDASPGLEDILPRTPAEYDRFKWLAVTAGITEEILFRGFLIWMLSLWVDPWTAGGLALIAFVVAHVYQESAAALVKVTIAGAVMTVLYLVSGSLLAPIILHAAIDLANNTMAWRIRQGEADAARG